MQSILAWAYAHPELAVAICGLIVNGAFALLKLFDKNRYVALFAKLVAAIFPDPAEIVDGVAKFIKRGPKPPSDTPAPDANGKDPRMTPTIPPKEPPTRLSSGFFMQRLCIMTLVAGLGVPLLIGLSVACAPLRDAFKFSVDETQCVFVKTDHGVPVATAVVECGLQNTADIVQFFADLVAQRAAARREGACEALRAADGAQRSSDQAVRGVDAASTVLRSVGMPDAGADAR